MKRILPQPEQTLPSCNKLAVNPEWKKIWNHEFAIVENETTIMECGIVAISMSRTSIYFRNVKQKIIGKTKTNFADISR